MTKILLIAPLGSGASVTNVIGGHRQLAAQAVQELGRRGFALEVLDTSGEVTNISPWRFRVMRLARVPADHPASRHEGPTLPSRHPAPGPPFNAGPRVAGLDDLQNRASASATEACRRRPESGVCRIRRQGPLAGPSHLDAEFARICQRRSSRIGTSTTCPIFAGFRHQKPPRPRQGPAQRDPEADLRRPTAHDQGAG